MTAIRRVLLAFHLPEALRDILQGITEFLRRSGAAWQVECVEPRDFHVAFRKRLADGAITALGPRSRNTLLALRKSRAPIVNVLRDASPFLPSVLSDNPAIGRAGAQYLPSRGFTRFAFLGVDTPWSRDRQNGFAAQLRDAGRSAPLTLPRLRLADFEYASRIRATRVLRSWVRTLPPGTAVMAAADFMARALLTACDQESIVVPAQIAILGVDNFHAVCELAPVPLTSVAQNFFQMGREAAALLHDLMNHSRQPPSQAILIPPGKLHIRKSTDVLAFDDPIVVSALHLIHARAATGISMKELLRQVPLSRKWLDHRFKQCLGHTPSEEIRRLRMRHVQELVLETDMPLRQIALRTHFSCVQNLVRSYRVAYSTTPERARKSR